MVMLTKTKNKIEIPRKEWERMKENPVTSDFIELLEDISDLEAAKKVKGKNRTIEEYIEKRLRNNS